MQTFLPDKDFATSARMLDSRRLGKQRVECLQILNALNGHGKGWRNHPCTKMWRGYSYALATYGLAICTEWSMRGYQDTCAEKIVRVVDTDWKYSRACTDNKVLWPAWLGDERLHSSHRQALMVKAEDRYFDTGKDDDVIWYARFKWIEPVTAIEYWWPV